MKHVIETLTNRRQVLAGGTSLAVALAVTNSAIASTLIARSPEQACAVFCVWKFPASTTLDVLPEAKSRRTHTGFIAQRLLRSPHHLTVQEEWLAETVVPEFSSAGDTDLFSKLAL